MPTRRGRSRAPAKRRTDVRRTPSRRRATAKRPTQTPFTASKAKRKKASSSKKKRVTTSTTVRRHLQGYLDPFSVTGGAKIPDGAVMQSLPLTHRVVKEINLPPVDQTPAGATVLEDGTMGSPGALAAGDGTGHIVLIPGLQCGLYWTQDPLGNANETDNYFTFSTDSWVDITVPVPLDDAVWPGTVSSGGGVSRWRVVSQGLKLTLLNTQEENDGWFECVRTTYKPRMSDWKIVSPIGNHGLNTSFLTTGESGFLAPDDKLIDYLESKNLAEHLSYKAGSLKDIHRHQFNLMPFSKNNEFVELQENYLITADEGLIPVPTQPVTGVSRQTFELLDGANSSKKIYESFMDTNHDIVLIKIHPGTRGSKLLAELAVNHEVVYDVDSVLSKHMTTTDVDEDAFKQAQEIKHTTNQTAAMIVE